MKLLDDYSPIKLFLISLASAIFIVYPNIIYLSWEMGFLPPTARASYVLFFVIRYLFFSILIWLLIRYNLYKIKEAPIWKRLRNNVVLLAIAYAVYVCITMLYGSKADCFGSLLMFQFFVVCIVCIFIGHVSMLYYEQRRKEHLIEMLKVENLQSRYDALTNQINPHFFFNSLNGLTALIRKKDDSKTLLYVDKLSDVFRYILQSDKKGLVTLEEELKFVQAFQYMMEVRFANKLSFEVDVENDKLALKIPVLSLLPLIDNVVVHNTIDSQHKMVVRIWLNDQDELVVSNHISPKQHPANTNGTGLKNLENRFTLLMNKQIRVESDGKLFSVYLPLK